MYPEEYLQTRFGQNGTAVLNSEIGLPMDGTQSFAIDAWVRIDNFDAKRSILSQKNNFSFGVYDDKPYFMLGGQTIIGKNCSLQRGNWHFLSMYYYAQKREAGLYVDGTEALIQSFQSIGLTESREENDFIIGENFAGDLRCIRIYDYALTQAMMEQNMYQEPANYVKAYLQFASSVPSDTQNKRNISLQGDVVCTANAAGAGFGNFNYAEVKDTDIVNPGGLADEPFSVQCWIYWKPGETQNTYTVFSNTDFYHQKGILLYLQPDKNGMEKIVVSFGYFEGHHCEIEYCQSGLSGRWMNLAVTYEKGSLILYLDGAECARRTDVIPLPEIMKEHKFLIGADYEPVEERGCLHFEGIFRNLDIFDSALDPEHIKTYMNTLPMEDVSDIVGNFSFLDNVPMNRVSGMFLAWSNGFSITESVRLNTNLPAETMYTDDLAEPFTPEEVQSFRLEAIRNSKDGERFYYVSTHKKDGTLYFVAHAQEGSYTVLAYEGELAESDETVWWTTLALIVIGGLLDVAACIRIRYTTGLQRFIGTYIVKNPTVRAFFTWSGGVSSIVTGILKFAKYIVVEGRVWELIKVAVKVSFWTIMGIVSKFILRFINQAAAIGYSLGSLALSILSHYNNRPVSLELADLFIKTVHFNHNTPNVADAINIRKNMGTAYEEPYEWNSNKADVPAVYSISRVFQNGKAVPIGVRVSFSYNFKEIASDGGIWIRGAEVGGDLFGVSDELQLSSIRDLKGEHGITFSNHTFGTKGIVGQDVSIKWQYSLDHQTWINTTITTHKVYSVLDYPKAPWGKADLEFTSLPWTELLDFLIDYVKGITSKDKLAKKITETVYSNLRLIYDTEQGASFYTGTFTDSGGNEKYGFNLKKFLDEDHKNHSFTLNCTDCACLVTTFANLYGCGLSEFQMASNTYGGFKCNKILAIGCEKAGWKRPFNDYFSYHEVAVELVNNKNLSGTRHKVYDACLQVDGRDTPWRDPAEQKARIPELPTGMSYSQNEEAKLIVTAPPDSYREHLADNSEEGILACDYFGRGQDTNYGKRPIKNVYTATHFPKNDQFKKQVHFLDWPWSLKRDIPIRKAPLFFTEQIPSHFYLQKRTGISEPSFGYTDLYYEKQGEGWLYITEILCGSEKEAQELLLGFLADSSSPILPPRLMEPSMDIGFGSSKNGRQSRAFTFGNTFVSAYGFCETHQFALAP